jgi:tRNA uridine 5-carboxymethylaminomethyl modification enzyme
LGLINDQAWAEYERKQARMSALGRLLAGRKPTAEQLAVAGLAGLTAVAGLTWAQLLKRPEVSIDPILTAIREELKGEPLLAGWAAGSTGASTDHSSDEDRSLGAPASSAGADFAQDGSRFGVARAMIRNEARAVETEIKFAGYLDQQKKSIEKLKAAEAVSIPEWLEYGAISGLSREMREKLERVRPGTIGQASRIPGVTPAALSLVHVSIRLQGAKRTVSQPLPSHI